MQRIEECISFLLGKAYQHINHAAKLRLAPYGVTPMQYSVLSVLWERDGRSGAELGERLQLDSATITGVLDRLANAALIERRPDASDRRINRVVLTERARELQVALTREIQELNVEVFGQFQAEDAARLGAMLAALGHVDSAEGVKG